MSTCSYWRDIDDELTHNATVYVTASTQKKRAMERRIAPKVFADPERVRREHVAILRWVRKGGERNV